MHNHRHGQLNINVNIYIFHVDDDDDHHLLYGMFYELSNEYTIYANILSSSLRYYNCSLVVLLIIAYFLIVFESKSTFLLSILSVILSRL